MPFRCPDCDAVSHHPEDERHNYCVRCCEFKPKRKIATTVYLPEYQLERLRLLKAATGLSAAELIRQGIDLMLEREYEHDQN